MLLGEIEREIFNKYKSALLAIGVDFTDLQTSETIEDCRLELESRFQAFICWYLYLKAKGDRFWNPNQILVQAFYEEWQPRNWKDEYLCLQVFQPIAEKARQKLSSIEFFKFVAFEIRENSDYVYFFYEGRMIWQVDIRDILEWSKNNLVTLFKEKTGKTITLVETKIKVL